MKKARWCTFMCFGFWGKKQESGLIQVRHALHPTPSPIQVWRAPSTATRLDCKTRSHHHLPQPYVVVWLKCSDALPTLAHCLQPSHLRSTAFGRRPSLVSRIRPVDSLSKRPTGKIRSGYPMAWMMLPRTRSSAADGTHCEHDEGASRG